jgi:ubiquinone/menaquinone biosynthesis C-methylase UbiE
MMTISQELARGAFNEVNFAFAPSLILWTALELGVFTAIENGATSVDRIAATVKCSEKGARRILNCLVAMNFLEKHNESYQLNDLSRDYFLPSSENYVGHLFLSAAQLVRYWLTLPEAVRTGRPTLELFPIEERETYNLQIVEALYQFHKKSAWELARRLPHTPSLSKILDVAAGSAVWSLPFAVQCPQVEVTAVDFPAVLEITRKLARRLRVEERYRFIAGDLREMDFGASRYDLALLGHICHSEGPRRTEELIQKCFRALRVGGQLLILDYTVDEKRKSDLLALVLALNALLGSEEGDTFTFSEYHTWLRQAGFISVEVLPIDGHSPVITATKE